MSRPNFSWASRWGMLFSVKKYKVMHVGRNNPKAEYFMNGEKLSESDTERDICVTISNNLKPSNNALKQPGRPMLF